ncbi:MAG: asparagine--tRNA ligase [Candidatus Thermoplasmatota archaeon]|nr:asparagine--tRNA ligase [Candidatus Thermoplasmatota archaeon]
MEFVDIEKLLTGSYEGRVAIIRGWIYRKRSSGKILFVLVRDSTGVIQTAVSKENVKAQEFEHAEKALIESSVKVEGTVVKDSRAPGGYELRASKFEVISFADVFPITEHQSEEFLLDKRHLWIRSRELTNVMKIKASLLKYAREWFEQNNFCEVTPPTITPSACEGGSTVFEFNYFDQKAYLSQSAQLYLEALIYSLEKVWSLTPSFRAEKSKTTRHLAEYWHLEAEAAWVDNNENMRLQEDLISYICQKLGRYRAVELKAFNRSAETLLKIEAPFKRFTYEECIKILQNKGFDIEYGADFGAKEERELSLLDPKPIFVTSYPKEIKAFYMKENPQDKRTYLCADMLAPEGYGEIIGGSERETDVDKLIERLKAENANLANYEWYLDLRRFGSVPHSGFGLGIERMLKWICKLEHIRDATPFPRTITRAYP